ncbi:MAG: hypothetical protein H7Y88_00500 [Phycisphaerales bacterium]|nr:hypothetical protein [Phycisphaerales bacterium]
MSTRRHAFVIGPLAVLGFTLLLPFLAKADPPTSGSFTPLGDLPGGGVMSVARGVSSDGSVVIGNGSSTESTCFGFESFRWAVEGGIAGLGDLTGGAFYSTASGVSGDGLVVIGCGNFVTDENLGEAYQWSSSTGMVGLGDLPGGSFYSLASGVNADGTVIVGTGNVSASPTGEAFRWTVAGGLVGLGDLAGGGFLSRAVGVNADGTIAVGNSWSAGGVEAFRWTGDTGMVGLGDLEGGGFLSGARAVTPDGSVIVGLSRSELGREAFRWTIEGGMVALGDVPGGAFESVATDVSDDGTIIVGCGADTRGSKAFIWTSELGLVGLKNHLMSLGVSGLDGWMLNEALAISGDGQTIVGVGTNPLGQMEAWAARLPSVPEIPPGEEAPIILAEPHDVAGCPAGSAAMSVTVGGPGPINYQWRVEAVAGTDVWMELSEGPLPFDGSASASGVATDTLTINNTDASAVARYCCWVFNTAGGTSSAVALLTVCQVDVNCDGVPTSADITAFLGDWFGDLSTGTNDADFNQSGTTTSADITSFLSAWFEAIANGC